MNDPHVESLTYRVVFPETIKFDGAPPITYKSSLLELHLDSELLTIIPNIHYESVESAKKDIEPFLRSWEIDVALRSGQKEVSFIYSDAKLVDRAPSDTSRKFIEAEAGLFTLSSSDVRFTVHRTKYPDPPTLFIASPDVETLWNRYQEYLAGREPLTSMAYFCLTYLEYIGGSRKNFADTYNISEDILNKLGEISTNKGDASTARKWKGNVSRLPLTEREIVWVHEAIKVIIRRVGEFSHIATLPIINLVDLPPLPP